MNSAPMPKIKSVRVLAISMLNRTITTIIAIFLFSFDTGLYSFRLFLFLDFSILITSQFKIYGISAGLNPATAPTLAPTPAKMDAQPVKM